MPSFIAIIDSANRIFRIDSNPTVLLILAFLCGVFLFVFLWSAVAPALVKRSRIVERIGEIESAPRRGLLAAEAQQRARATETIEDHFQKLEKQDPNRIEARLYRAGFYSSNAPAIFYALRICLCFGAALLLFIAGRRFMPSVPVFALFGMSFIWSLAFLIVPNFVLDKLAKSREEACRRGFPAFMDMLVVCVDAGMSLEAAIERVAQELGASHGALGIYLRIMILEIRAGRPLREALRNFGERVQLDEARTLATLFKQSEELGASLTQTLRVYSAEMRERRITAAEEKANALPVKMMLPLGLFVFPCLMIVIMLPLMIKMQALFKI